LALLLRSPNEGGSAASRSVPSEAFVDELLLQAPLGALLQGSHGASKPEAGSSAGFNAESIAAVLDAVAAYVPALSPLARGRVAGALLERLRLGGLGTVHREVSLLCELLMTSKGQDLVELKRVVDAGGVDQDLRHAVFIAITEPAARKRLLDHFQAEAARLSARPAHVLSDIDMTIWIGTFGAGPCLFTLHWVAVSHSSRHGHPSGRGRHGVSLSTMWVLLRRWCCRAR